jgi:hypothetical protein
MECVVFSDLWCEFCPNLDAVQARNVTTAAPSIRLGHLQACSRTSGSFQQEREKKEKAAGANVLLSVHLRIARPYYPLPFEAVTIAGLGR